MLRPLYTNFMVRLLLLTLVIGTIPVMALGSLSYFRAKTSLQEKVNESNALILQQTQLNVEQVLQLFENLMTQYVSTSTVNAALQTSITPSQFTLLNELAGGLNKMQPYELGVKNVYLVNLNHKWVLSNQGYEGLDASLMKNNIIEFANAELRSFWQAATALSTGSSPDAATGVYLVKKLPLNMTATSGLIIGEFPRTKLEKLIYNESEDRQTVILDASLQPITEASGSVLTSEPELQQLLKKMKRIPDKNGGFFTIKMNRETIGVNFTRSDYNGWYYLSVSSLSDITRDSRSIGWYTVYISMGTFVLILIMAWIGSTRMYRPIRRIFSAAVGQDPAVKRLAQDEFKVIGEHIQLLQSSQTNLKGQLRIHSRQLETFFIRRLLQGEIRSSETRERWTQFGYGSESAFFAIMTIQVDTLDRTRYGEQDMDLLMFAIHNITSELIPADERLEPVVMVDNQVTVCRSPGTLAIETEFDQHLYRTAELVQNKVHEILGLKVSIGISKPYTNIDFTHQAYSESLESLKYRVRFGEQAILPFTEVLPDTTIAAAYPEWLEKKLIDAIKMEEREQAKELLSEFIQQAIDDNPRYHDLQMMLTRLLIDLVRVWQEVGEAANPLQAGGKGIQEHLSKLRTAVEIENWFYRQVVEPMIDSLRHKWETQNKKISDLMLEMIHDQFDTNLTLELCATRLNYNPNYIRTVFRKETGSNFSDYLSQYRLSVAKRWLVETDLKISEIAEKLQYQNSQNFIRYFRKQEDMTPGQYREKHR
ncbi:helix-turn-helix transcriptional regulator [Cohnella sp. GbtcB17]|uniref:helix-turn-helix transcriptional regulator n=1 Tax=Cohnella sp. GbtcB17 TaxID=2824762 RepID=UPI001C2FFC75|nr:helix-turn-helix domain-containing protein [Cohnella sp. GbtcB17]